MRKLILREIQELHTEATRRIPEGGGDEWQEAFDKVASESGYIRVPECDCLNTRFGHTPDCGLRVP